MPNVFLIADTHFGHRGVCEFFAPDGVSPLRPWNTVTEMDEALVENWNSVVGEKDKVYHLGDVLINRRAFPTLGRLNGDKVLIKGNHDLFKLKDYAPYFRDIRAYHVMDKLLLCHIPVHPGSKGRFRGNIHGHTHANVVRNEQGEPDSWYTCVSVEQINYTPIPFEDVR